MASMRPRVAIVGAGPAGAFAAGALMRDYGDIEVDLFERLPTPWGLLRGGVAPDHQEIKRLEDSFAAETFQRGCRFLGNVRQLQNEVRRMVALAEPNSTIEPESISPAILGAMPNLRHTSSSSESEEKALTPPTS